MVRLLKKLLIRSYCGRVPQPCEARALLRAREQSQSPGGSQTDGISDKSRGEGTVKWHISRGSASTTFDFKAAPHFF